MSAKVKIRFKDHRYDNVTSSLGNLYPGKVSKVTQKVADEFIKLGYAEIITDGDDDDGAGADADTKLTKSDLKKKNKDDLLALAENMQIEIPEGINKEDLIDLILESAEEQA